MLKPGDLARAMIQWDDKGRSWTSPIEAIIVKVREGPLHYEALHKHETGDWVYINLCDDQDIEFIESLTREQLLTHSHHAVRSLARARTHR